MSFTLFNALGNNLSCISVDDEGADHSSWYVDPDVILSNDCGITNPEGTSRLITGAVTSSADGLPLSGATIIIQGTPVSVVTDLDGNYAISVYGDGEIFVCSYIGYETTEEPTGNRSTVNIALDPIPDYSPITGSGGSIIVDGNVTLYPNAVIDWLTVEFTDTSVDLQNVVINIFDEGANLHPVTIMESIAVYGFEVEFNSLGPGTYYVQIYDGIETRVFRILRIIE
jgi:hypothetical protein